MYEVNLFFFSGLDDDLKWSARKLLKKKKKQNHHHHHNNNNKPVTNTYTHTNTGKKE